jgi:DNA-binding CsgD family transcriptional regulator
MDIKQLQTELSACKSYHAVFNVMRRELSAIGYDCFVYGFQILESFKTPPLVMYSTYSQEWLAEYMTNNYSLHDPIMYHYTHHTTPLFWHVNDDWSKHPYGENAVEFMAAVRDAGYSAGVCIPVFSRECTRGFINLTVNHHSESGLVNVALGSLLIKYFHEATLRIWLEQDGKNSPLNAKFTKRESDVMRFIADGLTSRQTAQKLGISKRTIDAHIASAQFKLGCDNRQQLICMATNLGLIHPGQDYSKALGSIRWVLPDDYGIGC